MCFVIVEDEEVVVASQAYFLYDYIPCYQHYLCKDYIGPDNDRMHVDNMALDNDDQEVVGEIDPKPVPEGAIVLEMGRDLDMLVDRKEEEPDGFLVLPVELIAQIVSHYVHVVLVVPGAPNVLIDYDCVVPVDQFGQAVLEGYVN